MLFQHEDVCQEGDRDIVADDARKPDLGLASIQAERERGVDGLQDPIAGAIGRPVLAAQIAVHDVEIEPLPMGADGVRSS